MNYVLSDEPWNVLYPNENVNSAAHSERRAMVIDGYFNTSDKGVIILDILEYASDNILSRFLSKWCWEIYDSLVHIGQSNHRSTLSKIE